MIKWSGSVRLDEYLTVKALRRQIALVDKHVEFSRKSRRNVNEQLSTSLCKEAEALFKTLRLFGFFSDSHTDVKKKVELMKRIREDIGDVFLSSLRVANALDVDVSRSVHEKIYPLIKDGGDLQWKK